MCTVPKTCFLWPTRVHVPERQTIRILCNERPLSPSKLPLRNGVSEPRLIHASLAVLRKILSCIFKIQDSTLSGILRYLFIVSYLSISRTLLKSILYKWKILFQDTFPKILYFAQKAHFVTVT